MAECGGSIDCAWGCPGCPTPFAIGGVSKTQGAAGVNGLVMHHAASIGPFTEPDEEKWGSDFADKVLAITDAIAELLIEKHAAYGDSALNPVRIFSKSETEEQLLVRIDDKLSRIARGHEFTGDSTIDDLIGYLVLLKIKRMEGDNEDE